VLRGCTSLRFAALQVEDLSQQLRVLLKEQMRRAHGGASDSFMTVGAVSPPTASRRGSAPTVIPGRFADDLAAVQQLEPDDVISENLVSFKDIAELQTRNVQLLRVVRQLSDNCAAGLSKRQADIEDAAAAGLQV
jgi:hypothetical protein